MNERSIEIVREYNFDPKEVVAGLNGYYESDKRNGYITVKRNDVEGPAYLTAALYLSALIEWLREDFDIFYRPGMKLDQIEAARSAAKMCCLRAHIKDEICKRGIWCSVDADIPALVDTLFKAYDEEGERADENRKEVVKLSKENQELKEGVCKDIMRYIRQEASRNGFDLPEEIDGEPLTIKRVFHDLLELMGERGVEIRNLNVEIKAKESCIEYLFSLIEQRDRAAAILQDLYRDIFKKQPDGLSAEDIATMILDKVLETEALLHLESVDNYKLGLKDYILKDVKEHGYRYDGLENKSIEEIVDRIIQVATCPRNEWVDSEIRNLRGQIDRLKGLINAMNEEVKDM